MFMRLLQLKINANFVHIFKDFYEETVMPQLQKMPGCKFAELIQNWPHEDECLSMTFWENREAAENYQQSGTYSELLQKSGPYLAKSTEWKLQLSDSLELEYKPVSEEPVLKEFHVAEDSEKALRDNPGLHVRIVSIFIQENKADEFKHIYRNEVVPALLKTAGCKYAFLTENTHQTNEFISITGWDSKKAVDAYEKHGAFAALVDKVKHTFSQAYQWKMAQIGDQSSHTITTDDLSISYFRLLTGKHFDA